MCSIAGFYNSNRDFNTEHERYSYILNDMNKALAHRGPASAEIANIAADSGAVAACKTGEDRL